MVAEFSRREGMQISKKMAPWETSRSVVIVVVSEAINKEACPSF